jgi:hypothetical protein
MTATMTATMSTGRPGTAGTWPHAVAFLHFGRHDLTNLL